MKGFFALLFLVVLPVPAADAVEPARTPVVVELFTSEGCSSCPPADALLTKLNDLQPVRGVHVIALEEHVDYWDRAGWRDPFSSPEFTARQERYVQQLHLETAYTPQMVIDGRAELVGNNSGAVLSDLAKAARSAKISVHLTLREKSADHVSLAVQVDAAKSSGDVLVAITESKLATDVARGENAGHNLKHSAVVRKFIPVGKLKPGEAFSAETVVQLAPEWQLENLSAVVLVQERAGGRTLGAAEIALAN
jgi:hypothetical protein